MTRARQPALPLGRRGEVKRDAIEPFEFVPGPECEPRPEWVIPAELRLPTDPEPAT